MVNRAVGLIHGRAGENFLSQVMRKIVEDLKNHRFRAKSAVINLRKNTFFWKFFHLIFFLLQNFDRKDNFEKSRFQKKKNVYETFFFSGAIR